MILLFFTVMNAFRIKKNKIIFRTLSLVLAAIIYSLVTPTSVTIAATTTSISPTLTRCPSAVKFGVVHAGNLVFFGANDGTGCNLWKSDGTETGTTMVKSFPGTQGPVSLTDVNGTLFFMTADGWTQQLWKSDGTSEGTVRVTAVNPSAGISSGEPLLTAINNTTIFNVNTGSNGNPSIHLWRSDGTEAGTYQISDVRIVNNPGTTLNGVAYFIGSDPINGEELWRSDGTEAGTYIVQDINPGSANSFINLNTLGSATGDSELKDIDNRLYFTANDGIHGQEVWQSDGTETGTTMVADVNPCTQYSAAFVLGFSNNNVIFVNNCNGQGSSLWKTDGTAAGTAQITQLQMPIPQVTASMGNNLYFTARDDSHGYELWKTDGTGVSMVKDVYPGNNAFPNFNRPIVFGTTIYFSADDGVHGTEIWQSDGTANGTSIVADLNPGNSSNYPTPNTVFDNSLLFSTNCESCGWEQEWKLWKLQATPTPTDTPTPSPTDTPTPTLTDTPTPTSVPTYVINGSVYVDINQNGFQDSGENGYEGAEVILIGDGSQTVNTNTTGAYELSALPVGNYTVTLTMPNGYTAVTTNPVLVPLTANTTVHFGIKQYSQPIGYPTPGDFEDSHNRNVMNGTKFTVGPVGGTVESISAYVGDIDTSPNNEYQMAIYTTKANGKPGTKIAETTVGTLTANSWNTLPITASFSPLTSYWLMYNTNASSDDVNNLYITTSEQNIGAYYAQNFGAWPLSFPNNPTMTNQLFSMYVNMTPDGPLPTVLVGNDTLEAYQDSNGAGSAEAFKYTALTSGTANTIALYLNNDNAATRVRVGIYTDNNGNPGTLLSQAEITNTVEGSWNILTLPTTTITQGTNYWIAVLSPRNRGIVRFRDKASGGTSVGSQETNLTTLPSNWTTGPTWSTTDLSAYVY